MPGNIPSPPESNVPISSSALEQAATNIGYQESAVARRFAEEERARQRALGELPSAGELQSMIPPPPSAGAQPGPTHGGRALAFPSGPAYQGELGPGGVRLPGMSTWDVSMQASPTPEAVGQVLSATSADNVVPGAGAVSSLSNRIPPPPGFALSINPITGEVTYIDTSPLDASQPLAGWHWIPSDPNDPTKGEWRFVPSPDVLENPWQGIPESIVPWLRIALDAGGDLSVVPEGMAREWVRFVMLRAGEQARAPGEVPFGLGLPNFNPNAAASSAAPAPPTTSGVPTTTSPGATVASNVQTLLPPNTMQTQGKPPLPPTAIDMESATAVSENWQLMQYINENYPGMINDPVMMSLIGETWFGRRRGRSRRSSTGG